MYYHILIALLLYPTFIDVNGLPAQQSIFLRIVGGIMTSIRDISYQCSLWNGTRHFCGGALLSDEWVITAAHCLGKMGAYKVRINSTTSMFGGTLIDVIADYKHPYFNEIYSYDYDVGLINVKQFDSTGIKFINWPVCNAKKCTSQVGKMIQVSGWGYNNLTDPDINTKLQKASIPIVDYEECRKIYKNETEITPRMFCCGFKEGGKDSCKGDSGGPATCGGQLVGLISAGTEECALPNRPGLYTDLMNDKIQKWIKEKCGIVRDCSEYIDQNADTSLQEEPSRILEEPPALQPLSLH